MNNSLHPSLRMRSSNLNIQSIFGITTFTASPVWYPLAALLTLVVTGLAVFGFGKAFRLVEQIKHSKAKHVPLPQRFLREEFPESDEDIEMNDLERSKSVRTLRLLHRRPRPISRSPNRSPRPRHSRPVSTISTTEEVVTISCSVLRMKC